MRSERPALPTVQDREDPEDPVHDFLCLGASGNVRLVQVPGENVQCFPGAFHIGLDDPGEITHGPYFFPADSEFSFASLKIIHFLFCGFPENTPLVIRQPLVI